MYMLTNDCLCARVCVHLRVLGWRAVSEENILPSGSKRVSRAPHKFRDSEFELSKPGPKEEVYVPEAVRKKDTMNGHTVYQIKWQGMSESQNTWASMEQFSQAPLAKYKQLITEFEDSNKSPVRSARKSINKENKALWPPSEEPEAPNKSTRKGKTTGQKVRAVNKENVSPEKAPSPKNTRSRRCSCSSRLRITMMFLLMLFAGKQRLTLRGAAARQSRGAPPLHQSLP